MSNPFRLPCRTAAAASLLSISLLGSLCLPAAAAPKVPSPVGPVSQSQSQLADQYSSLSGTLLNVYATNSGQTLEKYLQSQKILLSPAPLEDPVTKALNPSATPSDLPSDGASDGVAPIPGADLTPGPSSSPSGSTTLPVPSTAGTSSTVAGAATLPSVPALGTADALGSVASSATPVNATTLVGLNQQLAGAGVTIDTSGYDNLDELARGVASKSNTVDGAVTIAGAKWMSQLGNLRTPKLTLPKATTPTAPAVPKDALVFGLFADKSLTKMLNSSPDMFASVSKSGVGSTALQKSWNASMLSVYNSSSGDLSKLLPDACTGGMLAVMATGDASSAKKVSGSGCSSSCITGGLYLNSQTSSLFSPGTSTSSGNPYSSLWNATTMNGLQRWQQTQLLGQNANVSKQLLADTQPSASASCSASSTATSNALNSTLPGIFGQLRTK